MVYDILGAEEQKCLVRRAAREREEEEVTADVVGGEKEDAAAEGGAVQVGGASVADVRQTTRREAVEAEENANPSRAKGEWARAIGC
jgi:hypothetical protein